MALKDFRCDGGKKIKLGDYPTGAGALKGKKAEYQKKMEDNLIQIAGLQEKLYSDAKEGLIIICRRWMPRARTAPSSM